MSGRVQIAAAKTALVVLVLAGSAQAAEPIGLLTIRGVNNWRARLTLQPPPAPTAVEPGNKLFTVPTVGAEVTTRISRNARLSFDVTNILDRRIDNLSAFPVIPGESRTAHIRLKVSF